MPDRPYRIGLLFAQFAAYHIDRCEAVGRRMAGRADVLAVEVATSSDTYAWEASGQVAAARKQVLFPGANYDAIAWPRRLWAQFRALRRCHMVLIGIGYNEPDIIALSWLLRLCGVQVVALSESKFDDKPRRAGTELLKALILAPYNAAIVGASRHRAYFRFLGFRQRPVLPGYDSIGVERIRAMGGAHLAPMGMAFADRNFAFVGRFVDKKNLIELVDAFALYRAAAGPRPRRLVLIGSGAEEAAIRARAEQRDVSDVIDFTGFLRAEDVAQLLAGSLALLLPSLEEQWGLVVNEALAFGLPVIASSAVGSTDVLVRTMVNGFVVEPGQPDSLAQAMLATAGDEAQWKEMVKASHARAWLGDTDRLADAVEALIDSTNPEPAARIAEFWSNAACKSGLG
ncbi:MAG: glycosyltransferase family 4 protein [Novosphingobium sp.]|uniref:glycosyltransferase family 4 protein n=1 Tax=Novosphingobium sp. TaxID=1874826 RepID=UPI0032BB1E1B